LIYLTFSFTTNILACFCHLSKVEYKFILTKIYRSLIFVISIMSSTMSESDSSDFRPIRIHDNEHDSFDLGTFPVVVSPDVWKSWIGFVTDVRLSYGWYWKLPVQGKKKFCDCKLSAISYPHWPPTSTKEAFDQLVYLTDEHNTHRRYLAHVWWVHVLTEAGRATVIKPEMEAQEVFNLATTIKELCPSVKKDSELIDVFNRRRASGWECYNVCEVVLGSTGSSTCLCFCTHHRDECPVHSHI